MKLWMKIYGVICAVGIILFVCFSYLQGGFLMIYFLDVGQGDAVFMVLPTGEQILVDGGPDDTVIRELSSVMPFFDHEIDALFLTHPHADHVNGLVEVLQKYSVKQIVLTGVKYNEAAYEAFLNIAHEERIDLIFVGGDFDLKMGSVVFDLLYPFESIQGDSFENINNSSIAMLVLYGDFSLFLAGDLEIEGEEKLIGSGLNLSADAMKASHHGSKTANSLELLKEISPSNAVISCGEGNSFNHPHIEAMRNFRQVDMQIYRTDIDGRIEIVSDGQDYSVFRSMSAPND